MQDVICKECLPRVTARSILPTDIRLHYHAIPSDMPSGARHSLLLPSMPDCRRLASSQDEVSALRARQVGVDAQQEEAAHRVSYLQAQVGQLESRLGFASSAQNPRPRSDSPTRSPPRPSSSRPSSAATTDIEAPAVSVVDRLNRLERRCEVRRALQRAEPRGIINRAGLPRLQIRRA